MKAKVAEFVEEMLRLIRSTFFAGLTEKQFFQEQNLLCQAICYPAQWLNNRGAAATASLYRRVLRTVIETIVRNGNRSKIERFSAYFFHCVQEHMKHHGEEYYAAAKAARSAADLLPAVLRRASVQAADVTTSALVETNKILRGRRRTRAPKNADSAPDLFSSCSDRAKPPQNDKKFLKPLQHRGYGAQTPQTAGGPPSDS